MLLTAIFTLDVLPISTSKTHHQYECAVQLRNINQIWGKEGELLKDTFERINILSNISVKNS